MRCIKNCCLVIAFSAIFRLCTRMPALWNRLGTVFARCKYPKKFSSLFSSWANGFIMKSDLWGYRSGQTMWERVQKNWEKSDGEFQRIRKGSSPFVGGIEMLDAEKEEQTTLFFLPHTIIVLWCAILQVPSARIPFCIHSLWHISWKFFFVCLHSHARNEHLMLLDLNFAAE